MVIYDSYFDSEDIDLSTSLLNYHDQSLIKCENEEHSNSEIVSNSSHFQTINHTHDFNIQKTIPMHNLCDDQTLIAIHIHDSLSNSQVDIGNHYNSTIMAKSCEKEIVLS